MNTTYICVCIYTPMNIKYVCVFTIGYNICVCACMPLNIIQPQKKKSANSATCHKGLRG